jgi:hypothetical protein
MNRLRWDGVAYEAVDSGGGEKSERVGCRTIPHEAHGDLAAGEATAHARGHEFHELGVGQVQQRVHLNTRGGRGQGRKRKREADRRRRAHVPGIPRHAVQSRCRSPVPCSATHAVTAAADAVTAQKQETKRVRSGRRSYCT